MTTIATILNDAVARLQQSSTPRLDAQLLLCEVLQVEKVYLLTHADDMLTSDQAVHYEALVQRRELGEPIAYILGRRGFYDIELSVTPAVLIPRPETEHLIEAALTFVKSREQLIAADIGTGSGAIAITVARHAPNATMHATDVSPDALAVARQNAETIGVTVTFHHGNLAQPLLDAAIKLDLLMANLPYIRTDELPELDVSKHEPSLALDGGEDGLDLVRELLQQARILCNDGALILLEIGAEQGQATISIAESMLKVQAADIIKDYAGHDRIVRIQL